MNTKHRDAYETLGVPKDADAKTIKKAFRAKAKKLHPDKGGDKQEFQELNRAYMLLEDSAKRAEYDTVGDSADNPNSITQRAESALAIEIVQCVSQIGADAQVIEVMTIKVAELLSRSEQMIVQSEQQAFVLKTVAGKIIRKNGKPNVLALALEQAAENATKQAQAARADAAWKREMLAVLSEYVYFTEPPKYIEQMPPGPRRFRLNRSVFH